MKVHRGHITHYRAITLTHCFVWMWQTIKSVPPELPRWWKPSKRCGISRIYIFTVSFGRLLFLAVMLEWYGGPVEEEVRWLV